jgi:hypothetical protein
MCSVGDKLVLSRDGMSCGFLIVLLVEGMKVPPMMLLHWGVVGLTGEWQMLSICVLLLASGFLSAVKLLES